MSDLFQNHAAKPGPVECLGQTFPSDEARREHYLKLLAEKLKDLRSGRSKVFLSDQTKLFWSFPIPRTTPLVQIRLLRISFGDTENITTRPFRISKSHSLQM